MTESEAQENLIKPDIQNETTLPKNPFPKGNKIWQLRSRAGPHPKFETPEALWEACCEYFQWVEDNPLWEERASVYRGKIVKAQLRKMRAMTLDGLAIFLDVNVRTWDKWRKDRPDLGLVITRVEQIIYDQKFTGAAAGLLNANIISRDLGLTEKIEERLKYLDQQDESKQGFPHKDNSDEIIRRAYESVKEIKKREQAEAVEMAKEQLKLEGWTPP